jgi:hypothetical protein
VLESLSVVIVVVRTVVNSRCETPPPPLPHTRRSCADDRMCQGWRSHQHGDVEDALYSADREVRKCSEWLGSFQAGPLTVNPAIVLILSAGQQRRRNVGQVQQATTARRQPAWLNRMPALVRQENLRPVATQASLILELEGIVAKAQRGGRSYRSREAKGGIVMRYVPGGAEIQFGATTFGGRSHTEIARLIAFDHGWKLHGDQIIDENQVVVTDTLEEFGTKSAVAGLVRPHGSGDQLASLWKHDGFQR